MLQNVLQLAVCLFHNPLLFSSLAGREFGGPVNRSAVRLDRFAYNLRIIIDLIYYKNCSWNQIACFSVIDLLIRDTVTVDAIAMTSIDYHEFTKLPFLNNCINWNECLMMNELRWNVKIHVCLLKLSPNCLFDEWTFEAQCDICNNYWQISFFIF
jgi:hypothetical protein